MYGSSVLAQTSSPTLPPEAQSLFQRGVSAANQGKWDLAIKCFSQAREAAPESPHVLFNLALAYSRAGSRDLLAIAWFRAYLAAAPKAPNAQQVRAQILDHEVEIGATAQELFSNAREAASQIPDDYQKDYTYKDIATAQAWAGDIERAKETAAQITGDKSLAYKDIVWAQAEAGDIKGAKETATRITGDKSAAYKYIAWAQARAGDIKGAKETAARITDAGHKSSAYKGIASAEAKMGDKAMARETTTQMQYEASAEIKSWTNLAVAYQQKRLLTDFLESLKDKPPKEVAKALAEAARGVALALKKLSDEEVKWQALRAKSTRQPGQSESRPKKR
ncbi:MAG TPA: tetratricopeptide repeat protein [Candidatus Hypogeohydataceae bacterium YC38]